MADDGRVISKQLFFPRNLFLHKKCFVAVLFSVSTSAFEFIKRGDDVIFNNKGENQKKRRWKTSTSLSRNYSTSIFVGRVEAKRVKRRRKKVSRLLLWHHRGARAGGEMWNVIFREKCRTASKNWEISASFLKLWIFNWSDTVKMKFCEESEQKNHKRLLTFSVCSLIEILSSFALQQVALCVHAAFIFCWRSYYENMDQSFYCPGFEGRFCYVSL